MATVFGGHPARYCRTKDNSCTVTVLWQVTAAWITRWRHTQVDRSRHAVSMRHNEEWVVGNAPWWYHKVWLSSHAIDGLNETLCAAVPGVIGH